MDESENRSLLRLLGIPVFSSQSDLAGLLHLDRNDIKKFVIYSNDGHYYREYTIRKRNGRPRLIHQPGKRLKAIQGWILRHILDRLSPSPYAMAYIRGRGLREAVIPHAHNRYFLRLDLEDFFPSIKKWRIEALFGSIGYATIASEILASLCTCKRVLPQGGVTSPALSNLVCMRLDGRMAGYARKRNLIFTRYADDIILSASSPSALSKCTYTIEKILRTEGFRLNEDKTRFSGPRRRCKVVGLVKDATSPRFGVGRFKERQMRAAIHNAYVKGAFSERYPSLESIGGWISYCHSVDVPAATRLQEYIHRMSEENGSRE